MRIGVPREVVAGERRVATTPEVAQGLQKLGYSVAVETGAGLPANFSDEAFEAAGPDNFVILPFDWHLDDWVHFTYEGPRGHLGLRSPLEVYGVWAAEFEYLYRKLGAGVFVLTMHPQCIGKGSRMLMLERLIEHMKEHDGVRFRTMADVAEDFRSGHPLEQEAGCA